MECLAHDPECFFTGCHNDTLDRCVAAARTAAVQPQQQCMSATFSTTTTMALQLCVWVCGEGPGVKWSPPANCGSKGGGKAVFGGRGCMSGGGCPRGCCFSQSDQDVSCTRVGSIPCYSVPHPPLGRSVTNDGILLLCGRCAANA